MGPDRCYRVPLEAPMAQRAQAHPDNAPGPFFVDRTCIDCGTCYEFLPEVFQAADGHSRVARQPSATLTPRAQMALLACPTGSIGSEDRAGMAEALNGFPDPIAEEVSFCGFTSEKSFGAWSYFIRREAGNVLMDVPRAAPPLLKRLEAQGGVALMVLSHKDDVADHAVLAKRFHCPRVLHRADLSDDTRRVERVLDGEEPIDLAPDLRFLPTPGHTRGSACLLYRDTFLFTGDHLWWDPEVGALTASRSYCWYDWPTQLASLERLLAYDFTWVLPGHGHAYHAADARAMRDQLRLGLDALRR